MEQCSHLGKQQALLLVPQAAEVGSLHWESRRPGSCARCLPISYPVVSCLQNDLAIPLPILMSSAT